MSERAQRVAGNEQRFRVFNEGVREVGAALETTPRFACECGDAACTLEVEIGTDQYRHVREDPLWFVVLPGHDRPDLERVVERHEQYLIVEKTGEGAEAVR
jgi:hypothetical protein